MSDIVRFSVSVEDDLLDKFDRYCAEEHFATRSEAVRQLIRNKLTEKAWASDATEVAGTLTLVYDQSTPMARRMAEEHWGYPVGRRKHEAIVA